MNKILLVYEDYTDLMSVEATLKKVGFDVIGLSSEYSVAEQMLSFNPDVVVGSGRGGKVSSLGVGKRLKEMTRWQGKSILIFPANFKPTPQELLKIRVDMILEAPVQPLRLLQVLAKILGHDEGALLERLNKAAHVDVTPKNASVAGSSKFTTEEEAIYVKGNTDEVEPQAGSSFSFNEEPGKDAASFALNQPEEERPSMKFRFGERMQQADREDISGRGGAGSSGAAEEAFPDVDLRSLERELLGGGAPEPERVEVHEPETEQVPEEHLQAKADLEKADSKLAEKMKKYAAMTADMKLTPKSNLTRVEARRRQKALAGDWNKENINELDKLRQEFTKALFKK